MKKKNTKQNPKPRYWVCIIGDTDWNKLPFGADFSMRRVVENQFLSVTGHPDEICYSGWSADAKAVKRILNTWH